MRKIDRRRFIKTTGLATLGVVLPNGVWALNKLEPLGDPFTDFSYRGWEDLYRQEWTWDKVGHAAHCVNCLANCAWDIYVKDGIVVREEQTSRYPQASLERPDFNPRGCQKGALHADFMYGADRLRYPLKRAGARGDGKWRRISWDQAATEIADKIIDIYEEFGVGALMTHEGTANQSDVHFTAGNRFTSLMGAVAPDKVSNVGDQPSGCRIAFGLSFNGFTSDGWFDADYIMLQMFNPSVTRMPDAHFIWEAKHNGCRVVSVNPDYNPSSIHADLWLPIARGSDPYFLMSMNYVVFKEDLIDYPFIKEQSDLPLLVRTDNRMLLRESDVVDGGSDEKFYIWDAKTNRAVLAPGTMGSDVRLIALGDLDPALEGTYDVNGIECTTVFERVRAEVMKYPPEETRSVTGIHPSVVYDEARALARSKKALILHGFPIGKYSNGLHTGWTAILLMTLTGHAGARGGVVNSWPGRIFPQPAIDLSAFHLGRFGTGGLDEWMWGEQWKIAKEFYDPKKLKERVGYDIDELQAMVEESIDKKWMPYWGGDFKGMIIAGDNTFVRNKAVNQFREALLAKATELYVNINIRMDGTARYADYVLPAAASYEVWDIRGNIGYHEFISVFDRPVPPVGESKSEWDIRVLLCQKIQERARTRGVGRYPDPDFDMERRLDRIYDDYTLGGKLLTDKDTTHYIIANSPEIEKGRDLDESMKRGFLLTNDHKMTSFDTRGENGLSVPFGKSTVLKQPWPTLSGRITFYVDQELFLRLGSEVPTARMHAGRDCTRYPLHMQSPHTRWGIHTTFRANKYLMRLQRGEPAVQINPKLAARKGIADGGRLRVFNGIGEFYAQAKFYPSLPEDAVMIEHGWDSLQFEKRLGYNSISAPLLQPLELAGGWGHIRYQLFDWSCNQLAHETGVDVEAA
jgi:dimethylsulfide dehydrogenase subunit alpha/complex iron-sulfur molybdoenzyme family reductase subunit alpha